MDLTKNVEKLDRNMDEVVGALGDIVGYLGKVDSRFAHLEGHVSQLSKRPAVIVKPNSKLFLLTACAATGYLGYKLADRRFRERLQKASEETLEKAKQAYEESIQKFQEAGKQASEKSKRDDSISVKPDTTQN